MKTIRLYLRFILIVFALTFVISSCTEEQTSKIDLQMSSAVLVYDEEGNPNLAYDYTYDGEHYEGTLPVYTAEDGSLYVEVEDENGKMHIVPFQIRSENGTTAIDTLEGWEIPTLTADSTDMKTESISDGSESSEKDSSGEVASPDSTDKNASDSVDTSDVSNEPGDTSDVSDKPEDTTDPASEPEDTTDAPGSTSNKDTTDAETTSAGTTKPSSGSVCLYHADDWWVVALEPTCTEYGYNECYCPDCGEKSDKTVPIAPLGHVFESNRICYRCGLYDDTPDEGLEYELREDATGSYYSLRSATEHQYSILIIPETYDGLPVKAISSDIFWAEPDMLDTIDIIIMPDSILYLFGNTFSSFTSKVDIVFSKNLCLVGDWAFWRCQWLESIVLPDSVEDIGCNVFAECYSLKSITLPAGLRDIGSCAFTQCTSLTEVNIPEGVTTISDSAFSECTALTQITLPEGVTTIEMGAFQGCTALAQVTLPKSLKEIGIVAFDSCPALTEITYNGTLAEWEAVTKGQNWYSSSKSEFTVYCTDGSWEST